MRILEGTLDELAPAFILVNRSAQVFWTNYRAELLLAERDLLLRNGGNLLASSTPTRTTKLREAIANVSRIPLDGKPVPDEFLLLPRAGGGDDLVVLRPVSGRHDQEGNDAVLVIVPRHDASDQAAKLIKAFGLIPSEARLVGALIRTGSSVLAASEIGITDQTAKTYLKRIYAKLGINSQLELGVMVAQLAPPLRGADVDTVSDHQITTF
jgi:DNA-binding CsgD family transcriptional regulator